MTAAAPWLTVVMPVHNGARDLPATLDSVARQNVDGIEFLLYDSSADDSCARIAAAYADRLSLTCIASHDRPAWPDKTNRGVERARAAHVAMLHQDDIWLDGHVDALRRALGRHPGAVLHIAPALLIDEHGRRIGRWSPPLRAGSHDGRAFGRRLLIQNFIAIPTPVIRRDAWLACGGMDPVQWYTADWDLYLKVAARGEVALDDEATTAFRLHSGSLTMDCGRRTAEMRAQLEQVLDAHAPAFAPGPAELARARLSVEVNCALAAASGGDRRAMGALPRRMAAMGPVQTWRYMRGACLVQRLWPRLRLKLAGAL